MVFDEDRKGDNFQSEDKSHRPKITMMVPIIILVVLGLAVTLLAPYANQIFDFFLGVVMKVVDRLVGVFQVIVMRLTHLGR